MGKRHGSQAGARPNEGGGGDKKQGGPGRGGKVGRPVERSRRSGTSGCQSPEGVTDDASNSCESNLAAAPSDRVRLAQYDELARDTPSRCQQLPNPSPRPTCSNIVFTSPHSNGCMLPVAAGLVRRRDTATPGCWHASLGWNLPCLAARASAPLPPHLLVNCPATRQGLAA